MITDCVHCGWQGHSDDYIYHIDDCIGDTSMSGGQDKKEVVIDEKNWEFKDGEWMRRIVGTDYQGTVVYDMINHPSHYNSGKMEVIDFIEDQDLDFHTGNVVKYVCRAGKKTTSKFIQDLEKAKWYLDRYIQNLKTEE